MAAGVPDLSVIILTWLDQAFLPACLNSVRRSVGDLHIEIVLIENGGPRLDRSFLPEMPGLKLIRNESNRGVAAARNQGLRAARGRYLLLLDVDTQVCENAFEHLVRFVDANCDVGLAAPRLMDAEGHVQFTCRNLPTVSSKVLRRMPSQWARSRLGKEMLAEWDHQTVRDVDYVIGACQMIRRQAFEQVGYLDERIFYGPEDVDYCIRLWQYGWRVVYVPQAMVIHYEHRVTRRKLFSRLSLLHGLGLAFYFWKHRYLWRAPRVQSLASNCSIR